VGLGYAILESNLNIFGTLEVSKYDKTLYGVFKKEVNKGYAKKYNGDHQDSMDASKSTQDIYHFYADTDAKGTEILNKNNVVFADHCWQMIRTTDTGGVRLLYNGKAEVTTVNNEIQYHCGDTRLPSLSEIKTRVYIGGTYLYASDYTVSKSGDATIYTLVEPQSITVDKDNSADQIAYIAEHYPYTCKNNTGTCTISVSSDSSFYKIDGFYSVGYANAYLSVNDGIGLSEYNISYDSLAYVGYMYNKVYQVKYNYGSQPGTDKPLSNASLSTSYWYADSITYDAATSKYSLNSPYKVSSALEYKDLVGKYTLQSTTDSSAEQSAQYIAAVEGNTYYYKGVHYGYDNDHYTYTYGDRAINNSDGTYTIYDATTINVSDYPLYYNDMKNKFLCFLAENDTCSGMRYISDVSKYDFKYVYPVYSISKDFTYDGNKYTLGNDKVVLSDLSVSTNLESLNKHHYTCFNLNGECEKLYYIFYSFSSGGSYPLFYVELSDGKSIEDALNEMLYDDDVNQIDSVIKTKIDEWYEKKLKNTVYEEKLDDTIYCNDRSQSASSNGWIANGGDTSADILFDSPNANLKCSNITDSFSLNNEKAKLKYSIGLITKNELDLLNEPIMRSSKKRYWTATPHSFYREVALENFVNPTGITDDYSVKERSVVSQQMMVRPAISLVKGTKYSDGDGSMTNPYVVDMSE